MKNIKDYNINNMPDRKEAGYLPTDLKKEILEMKLKDTQGLPDDFPRCVMEIVEDDKNGFTFSRNGLIFDPRTIDKAKGKLVFDSSISSKVMRIIYQLSDKDKPRDIYVLKPNYHYQRFVS